MGVSDSVARIAAEHQRTAVASTSGAEQTVQLGSLGPATEHLPHRQENRAATSRPLGARTNVDWPVTTRCAGDSSGALRVENAFRGRHFTPRRPEDSSTKAGATSSRDASRSSTNWKARLPTKAIAGSGHRSANRSASTSDDRHVRLRKASAAATVVGPGSLGRIPCGIRARSDPKPGARPGRRAHADPLRSTGTLAFGSCRAV